MRGFTHASLGTVVEDQFKPASLALNRQEAPSPGEDTQGGTSQRHSTAQAPAPHHDHACPRPYSRQCHSLSPSRVPGTALGVSPNLASTLGK